MRASLVLLRRLGGSLGLGLERTIVLLRDLITQRVGDNILRLVTGATMKINGRAKQVLVVFYVYGK